MKKRLLLPFILFLLLFSTHLFAEGYPHHIYGQINSSILFEVNILQEAIPFNLDSDLVKFNANNNDAESDTATGIRIGTYTLASNSTALKVSVSHTPFVFQGTPSDNTKQHSINYRLYMMTEIGRPGFVSTLGEEKEILGLNVTEDGIIRLINKYMYVTLQEGGTAQTTQERLDNLEPGTYTSDITFTLWTTT